MTLNCHQAVHLTREQMSAHSGCLSKLHGCELEDLLTRAHELAFGLSTTRPFYYHPQDCSVIPIDTGPMLATTDIGPLVGADLYCAGYIAAMHAMSDIFARGGMPRWVLPILIGNPDHPVEFLEMVMTGILQACHREGAEVIGGHTSIGPEAMAGLTVMGLQRSKTLISKTGAQPGDQLLLSKSLGVGMIIRAYKLGLTGKDALEEAVAQMMLSNGPASISAINAEVHAGTDVSGFGLLGHLTEMLGDTLGASLQLTSIPLLNSLACLPPGFGQSCWSKGNMDYANRTLRIVGKTDASHLAPLLDPQTNGGLLVAVDEGSSAALIASGYTQIGVVTRTKFIEIL